MLFEDDFDLTTQYYRLRGQHIYYQHILDNYRRYGELAPVLAQFSSLCDGFTHDLGNGLNGIRSRLERFSTEQMPPEYAQAIEKAKAICDICGWRLRTLQEISPSMPIYPEPLNLPKFVPDLLERLEVWQPPPIQIKFQTTVSRLIVADYASLLRLALLELLLNAWQAMPHGGQIIVSLQKLDSGLAQIEIVDNGPGLSDDPEQCFDLRFTTKPHRYRVGLYVARKIIEKHRGTFKLLSETGQGTRIIMQLPVGNPELEWDDENELVQALEKLHDTVAEQKREIETYNTIYNLPREQMLTQLSDLFGRLSISVVQFLTNSLIDIRHLLDPLSNQVSDEVASNILKKCDHCINLCENYNLNVSNKRLDTPRILDPTLSIQLTPPDLSQIDSQDFVAKEYTILIVDDTPANLRMLAEMLRKQGYKVRPAPNGKRALSTAKNELPDLILLDIMMPGMDGFEVCRQLKADERTRDIPIIFISALNEGFDKMTTYSIGGVDYITKPFHQEEVLARIHTHLSLQDMHQKLQEENKQFQQQNQELDAFAHTIAHDLKSPLGKISTAMGLAIEEFGQLDPDDLQMLLQISLDAGLQMNNIVDDLLLLASVRKEAVQTKPIDMESVVSQAIDRLAPMIDSYQPTITPTQTWPQAQGYAPWIEEVWVNYLSNGLKYGGSPPKLELGATLQANGMVRFWIQDNGSGLTPEEQATLFIEFTRLNKVRSEGHGLGLSVVRRIIDRLGGQVGVESDGKSGPGSVFYFTLPSVELKQVGFDGFLSKSIGIDEPSRQIEDSPNGQEWE